MVFMDVDKSSRILIADSNQPAGRGLLEFLRGKYGFVGYTENMAGTIEMVRENRPNVAIIGSRVGDDPFNVALDRVRQESPDINVVLFDQKFNGHDSPRTFFNSGIQAYLEKSASPSEIHAAVDDALRGKVYVQSEYANKFINFYWRNRGRINGGTGLTYREDEVLTLIASEYSNKEIASKLGVKVRTVETHRERIMRKLDLHNVAKLTRYAVAKGLVKLDTKE